MVSKADVVCRALECGMSVEIAAKLASVTPKTVYNWREQNPDFAERFRQCREATNALARGKLIEAIVEGDLDAVKYWLSNCDGDFLSKSKVVNEHQGSINTFSVDWSKYDDDEKAIIRQALELLERGRDG